MAGIDTWLGEGAEVDCSVTVGYLVMTGCSEMMGCGGQLSWPRF